MKTLKFKLYRSEKNKHLHHQIDSDEDVQAAENAGAVGVRVERFMKREEELHVASH